MSEAIATGADAVAVALEELGVDIVFGITGAGISRSATQSTDVVRRD